MERAIDGSFIPVVLELPRKERRAEPFSSSEKKKGAEPPSGALKFSPSHMTTTSIKMKQNIGKETKYRH